MIPLILVNLKEFFQLNPVFINNGRVKPILEKLETLTEINEINRIAVFPTIKRNSYGYHALLIFYNRLGGRDNYILRLACNFHGYDWETSLERFYAYDLEPVRLATEHFKSMENYVTLFRFENHL